MNHYNCATCLKRVDYHYKYNGELEERAPVCKMLNHRLKNNLCSSGFILKNDECSSSFIKLDAGELIKIIGYYFDNHSKYSDLVGFYGSSVYFDNLKYMLNELKMLL